MTNGKLEAVVGRKNTIIQPRNAVKMYRMAIRIYPYTPLALMPMAEGCTATP